MKTLAKAMLLLISVTMLSCVPLKQYRQAETQLKVLKDSNKLLNKDIRQMEKNIRILEDTLKARNQRAKRQQEEIQKRINNLKIVGNVHADALKKLHIREPESATNTMEWLTGKNMKDTNSARNTTWLSADEKKVYYYLNQARMNPKWFCNTYIVPRLKYDPDNVYLLTLIDYMMKMPALNALVPGRSAFESAHCHAETSGKTGYVGHERQKGGCKSDFWGECCSYGVSDPLGIVIQLLVDENVESLGHRYICLGWYSEVGISIQPHKGWGVNTVLDFK